MTKGEIVKQALKEFPDAKTRTLAHVIYNRDDNHKIFKDVEAVRGAIRYYRGNTGKKGRKKLKDKTFIKPNGKSGNPFELPESKADDWESIKIPVGNNKILLLQDIHVPYQDNQAIKLAVEYGRQRKVNTVILNGDIIDFYQASRFVKDPRKTKISKELQYFKDFISWLYYSLNEPKIYFKQGNHEERFETYMCVKAPELIGVPEFELNILLEFGKYGIEYIDRKRIIHVGDLNVLHGHEFSRSVFSPVNPARGLFMRAKENSIIGHHHQTSEHTEPTLNGKIITTWSAGCLCYLHPEYMPINKWNHGFAGIETDNNSFTVDNKRIHKGKIL